MKVHYISKNDGRAFVFVVKEGYTLTGTHRPNVGFEIREFETYSAIVDKIKEVNIIDVISDSTLQQVLKDLVANEAKINNKDAIEAVKGLIEGI